MRDTNASRKASKSSPKSQTDQGNESFIYEDEEEEEDLQLSGEDNESDLENANEGDQMLSDEENSSDNDDEKSLADSLSF